MKQVNSGRKTIIKTISLIEIVYYKIESKQRFFLLGKLLLKLLFSEEKDRVLNLHLS